MDRVHSLVPVVDSSGEEINHGAMVRYLAEMVWYPWAATQDYIEWEEVDTHHAEATMGYKGVEATGVFTFADGPSALRPTANTTGPTAPRKNAGSWRCPSTGNSAG